MGCSELGAEVWCRDGNLTALELGDEAIVEVADFSLQGRQMRNVRQMAARVCRQGYEAQVRRVCEVPAEEVERLVRRADSWRGSPTERGFSMALGRVGWPGDGECVIATATENGVLRGLLHFVPWGSDGLSLDLMRRERTAQPGVNDFLIETTGGPGTRHQRVSPTSRCSARRWPGASGSAPGRCAPGGASCCSPPVGSRSSRCTPTPSSARVRRFFVFGTSDAPGKPSPPQAEAFGLAHGGDAQDHPLLAWTFRARRRSGARPGARQSGVPLTPCPAAGRGCSRFRPRPGQCRLCA
jgi:hypothetical protein